MPNLNTEILVIGGGATGTGVARDLAMRGFKTVLLEKGDLTHGTTGRYHGLLHSGGRYAVKDPAAARECIEENRILRRIMPHCIEDTGGFFVVTPWDEEDYADRFLEGCQTAGIDAEEISIAEMLRAEPLLNPQITRCFRVPDGSADSFLAADANALSIRQHGGQTLTYHQVLRLIKENDRVVGALCRDLVKDEELTISADLVVNASGAWCGQIAASAGVEVKIIPGKGTMLAVNHRIVNTVINRCKLPSDGDIIVPAHTVAVVGTTDVPVPDPDHFAIEPWEVELMLSEGDKLVPGLRNMRIVRAWAGVRPLYQETAPTGNRDVTRAFVLLDHETRDGLPGLITITSGKWTTYRKMAEAAADLACAKLGVQRECQTHLEPLPGAGEHHGHHYLGMRLAHVEKEQAYGDLVCECELATYEDVEKAITEGHAVTIDDVRRDARLGMGPCQGGFCTYRAAGILHALRKTPPAHINASLRDFLLERWKGLLPILWGQQLRQERLDELIYLDVLGTTALPGPEHTPLKPVLYTRAVPENKGKRSTESMHADEVPLHPDTGSAARTKASPARQNIAQQNIAQQNIARHDIRHDVLIVGMGLAGLAAAWQAARRGKRVRLISKGMGTTHWGSGCIDVLGYYPAEGDQPLESPRMGIERLVTENPAHPYARIGIAALDESLGALQEMAAAAGYPLRGSLDRNFLLPTALGSVRPTCLAPASMTAGDLRSQDPMLLVGFNGFRDFYPELAAANLTEAGIAARGIVIDLPALAGRRFITGRTLAAFFDLPEGWEEAAGLVKPHIGEARRIGFPAVLGLTDHPAALAGLEKLLGLPVFEIPVLPPSLPGIRLHNLMAGAAAKAGATLYDGMLAAGIEAEGRQVTAVLTEAAARKKGHRASRYILASGGILGGGITTTPGGEVHETVFNLPVHVPAERADWLSGEFLAPAGHPIYRAGILTGPDLRPVDPDGNVVYENLYAAGNILGSCDPIQERSLEGIALATGYILGKTIETL